MAPRPARQSPAQHTRIATANRINKGYKWKTNRKNTCPRGLVNAGNNCYRIAVLQTLLHLPRFVNWILEHRECGKHWDCRFDDLNRHQPIGDRLLFSMRPHAIGCIPCLLKSLIQAYWGIYKLRSSDSGMQYPQQLDHNDPAIIDLHRMAERWFCSDPDGLSDELKAKEERKIFEEKMPMTQKEKDTIRMIARLRNARAQQCADEFMRFVLDGVEQSYTHIDMSHGQRRQAQYDSLFTLTRQEFHTCSGCNERYFLRDIPELGFRVVPLASGPDTLQAAIDRSMADRLTDVTSACSSLCKQVDLAQEWVIDAAPEYLRVHLELNTINAEEVSVKNMNALQIPEMLDITKHMTFQDNPLPVRYRLTSIVYHRGNTLRSGHYAAGVTSSWSRPPGFQAKNALYWPDGSQFFCNDNEISHWRSPATMTNNLTINPVNFSTDQWVENEFNPYILWYTREPNVKVKAPVVAIVNEGSIAARLVARKRAARA